MPRSFNNQREAVIAALTDIGRAATPKEVAEHFKTKFGITITDRNCNTVMADMEINGKGNVPTNEKILLRVGRGVYDLKSRHAK